MKVIKNVLAFLLGGLSAFGIGCVVDFSIGRIVGLYVNTFPGPLALWLIVSSLSILGSIKLSNNKWFIVIPFSLYSLIILPAAIRGSHPHTYLIVVTLVLIAISAYKIKGGHMRFFGNLFKYSGIIVFAITGIWGYFLCLSIITKVAGFWGLVISLCLTPITFLAAPLYAGFAWSNWFPLILNYGGGITAAILFGVGSAINKD